MVKLQTRFHVIVNILFFMVLGIGLGFFIKDFQQKFLTEFIEIRNSDVIGAFGTIYALITAFILITAWSDFKDAETSISNENKALISLWNHTDFMEDKQTSEEMQVALSEYIDQVVEKEIPDIKNDALVSHPTPKFINIMKVIDKLKIEDNRSYIAFEALVRAYGDLSDARNNRIDRLERNIPLFLKIFYVLASIDFWALYLVEDFSSQWLYFLVLVMVTSIVVLAYAIIFDLDQTLHGSLQVDISNYKRTKEYIQSVEHELH